MMKIKSNKFVNRRYKISVNFGFIYFYTNSMSFKLPKRILPYVLGFLYFILNLFTGLWGMLLIFGNFQGLRNTYSAIYINLTGGEDVTKEDDESNFDGFTVYIYNNLEREIIEEISLLEVDIILDIQELYLDVNPEVFTIENEKFILRNLAKVNLNHLNRRHVKSIFKTVENYYLYNTNLIDVD